MLLVKVPDVKLKMKVQERHMRKFEDILLLAHHFTLVVAIQTFVKLSLWQFCKKCNLEQSCIPSQLCLHTKYSCLTLTGFLPFLRKEFQDDIAVLY